MTKPNFSASTEQENFEDCLENFFKGQKTLEKFVATAIVREVNEDDVRVDVLSESGGYLAEGYIPLKEFRHYGEKTPEVDGQVRVFVEHLEGSDGSAALSYERAKREMAWQELEQAHEDKKAVEGAIVGRVRGGFTVNIQGVTGFLPGSQIDVRPIKDPTPLMDIPLQFRLLKIDRARNNIVVSRRVVIEDARLENRSDLMANLEEGQVVRGEVKNITDYGAFVDLGGIDGLLHVTDMSWERLEHPRDLLTVGQDVEVKIIRFNRETGRISLGMKQLQGDPWEAVVAKYKVGARVKGRVTNVTDYGAFVEMEPGIEGLIHVSEMSWSKRTVSPTRLLSPSQEVEVEVLEVDQNRRRLSLGLKQCQDNPWEKLEKDFVPGTIIERPIKDVTPFGFFVELEGGVDGIVHAEDISWRDDPKVALSSYNKGDVVKLKILRLDRAKEQIALGIKQLEGESSGKVGKSYRKGDVVTCVVAKVVNSGVEVTFGDDMMRGFIKRAELSRDRDEQRTNRFAPGEKLDAKILLLDENNTLLSIKARELDEERSVVAEYGSSNSGATLRDILGVGALGDITGSSKEEEQEETPVKEKQTKAGEVAKDSTREP